jgi:uncharacterized iron-regulated membrane protein
MDDGAELTTAERWAARRARDATWFSLLFELAAPCLMVIVALQSAPSTLFTVVALAMVVFLIGLSWWERTGLKRLLARRDRELHGSDQGVGSV